MQAQGRRLTSTHLSLRTPHDHHQRVVASANVGTGAGCADGRVMGVDDSLGQSDT